MAKKNSESNTGLIVTLVFFVLATITLGVFTYLGYAGQADLEKKAKDAKGTEETMLKNRDQELLRASLLRTAMGIPEKDDASNISSLKREHDADVGQQVRSFNRAFESFGSVWDPKATDAPNLTLRALATALQDGKQRAEAAQKQAQEEQANAAAEHEKERARLTADLQTARAAEKKAKDDLNAEKKRASDAFLQTQQDLTAKQTEKDTVVKNSDATVSGLMRQIKKLQAEIAQLKLAKEKLESDRRTVDLLGYDQPKGRIERVDQANGLVYINLGWADYVRPQLSFSVLPAAAVGKGALDLKRKKAAVEVVTVLGAHVSTAKITEVTSTRDPIIEGDLLFNPAWSPNIREHVAIVGLIDINGDGQDDTIEFVRNLERQGVVVDLYLDLKDLTTHGPGMTYQTSYLVMGAKPEQVADRPGDRLMERKKKLRDAIESLEAQAKGMGIQVIGARKFLAMIGYPLPRLHVEPNFAAGGGVLNGPATPAPPGGEGQAPGGDEKKK